MSQTIAEIIDKYLKYQQNIKSFSPLTLKAYRLDLCQALKYKLDVVCSYGELWGLIRPSLSAWGNLSLASRNRKIATLKSFFSWLYEQKYLEINYSNQLICPKVPKKIPHFLSVDEVISIIDHLNKKLNLPQEEAATIHALKQKTLFLLLYGAGLRISEACQLKWSDVNLKERKILILGKGNKERYAILPNFCVEHLQKTKKNQTLNLYIFGTAPLNTRTGYEYIHQLGIEIGLLNSLHPHSLRHSYATHLLASGANLRTLQKLLGHESLQATEKYTHLSVDHLARLIEKTHPLKKMKLSE